MAEFSASLLSLRPAWKTRDKEVNRHSGSPSKTSMIYVEKTVSSFIITSKWLFKLEAESPPPCPSIILPGRLKQPRSIWQHKAASFNTLQLPFWRNGCFPTSRLLFAPHQPETVFKQLSLDFSSLTALPTTTQLAVNLQSPAALPASILDLLGPREMDGTPTSPMADRGTGWCSTAVLPVQLHASLLQKVVLQQSIVSQKSIILKVKSL